MSNEHSCFVCKVVEISMPADVAFCAGIAFVASFTNEGVVAHLCEEHQETLKRGARRGPTRSTTVDAEDAVSEKKSIEATGLSRIR